MFSKSYNQTEKKNRQINTLKVFNQNVTEKIPGEEYHVESPRADFILHIKLPKNFPDCKPTIKSVPSIAHPWVDEKTGEVKNAPGMLNFTEHSDLGRVVHAIVRELARKQQGAGSMQGVSSPPPELPQASGHFGFPDLNSADNEQSMLRSALAGLSVAQLQTLKESEDQVDEFLEQLPPIRILEDEIERIILENEQIAKDTVEKESLLTDLKSVVKEKVEKVQSLNHNYEEKSISYQEVSNKFMPSAIKDGLHKAAVESDQQSDKLAEQFLEGEMDVDPFLTDYISARKMSHNRRIREEKLGKQLHDLERAGY